MLRLPLLLGLLSLSLLAGLSLGGLSLLTLEQVLHNLAGKAGPRADLSLLSVLVSLESTQLIPKGH